MSKLSLVLLLGAMSCLLEEAYSNNFYYYPNSPLNYQYQPFSPYVYSAYAVPVDCDKSTTEGGGEEGSSSESSSSESTEGTEGSSESSSEESKEGESSSEEGKKEEGGEEEGKKEEKKEEKKEDKKMVAQYIFPPVSSYAFAPQTAQQVVYSAPASYPYMPYKSYSAAQPATYTIKSSGYNSYPYYSLSSVPVSGSYSAPVSARVVSPAATYPAVSKTITFGPASGVGGPAGYWNGNVGYYRV